MMRDKRIVMLEVRSYIGISLGAVHCYGVLRRDGADDVELSYIMSVTEAKRLSEQDQWNYRAGEESTRFESLDALRARAIEVFRSIQDVSILLEGDFASGGPHRVLVGPSEFIEWSEQAFSQAEKMKWYALKSNWSNMDDLAMEWENRLTMALNAVVLPLASGVEQGG